MPWIAPVISGAAGLIGAGISHSGGSKANRMNLQIAREQMAFQERMSNTSVQRRMEDLKAANLNPALGIASAAGGASSPPGAAIPMQNEDALAGPMLAQIAQTTAQTALIRAQAKKTNAEAAIVESDVPYAAESAHNRYRVLERQAHYWEDQVRDMVARARHTEIDANAAYDLKELEIARVKLENRMLQAGLTEAEIRAKLFKEVPAAKYFQLLREASGFNPFK